MVQDLVHNLCESLVVNIGGVAGIGKKTPPTPITYLTQWTLVGNSEVHTDQFLTSWKVSGNSVVDNNTILSCGDLGQDGKYHVKISNGVDIYDIALTEPLRKVNDVADTIEFPSGTEGKALVIRNLDSSLLTSLAWNYASSTRRVYSGTLSNITKAPADNNTIANIICEGFTIYSFMDIYREDQSYGIAIAGTNNNIYLKDDSFLPESGATLPQAFYDYIDGKHFIYELATPTTELVDAPQIAVSPTDTYTSANVVSFSAFEHTENKEIWSCGEYSEVDGKYHILVQPQGGSIADIALDEPLRKVNNVADTIEFPSGTEGKALVTRNLYSAVINTCEESTISNGKICAIKLVGFPARMRYVDTGTAPFLCNKMETLPYATCVNYEGIACCLYETSIYIRNSNIEQTQQAYQDYFDNDLGSVNFIYQLATPTTELVDAPQIAEADSYSMVISQGGEAVSWSSFDTE